GSQRPKRACVAGRDPRTIRTAHRACAPEGATDQNLFPAVSKAKADASTPRSSSEAGRRTISYRLNGGRSQAIRTCSLRPRQLDLPSRDIAAGTASVATLDRKGAVTLQSPPLKDRGRIRPARAALKRRKERFYYR